MEIKNRYIVFDTNMWLKILSNTTEIDKNLLSDLQKQNKFGIYNMSMIEILMRFYRQKNFRKIREVLGYINTNWRAGNLDVGDICCPYFDVKNEEILELSSKSDEEIIIGIEKLKKKRFEFKASIITLFILILLEFPCPCFDSNKKVVDRIVECCESKTNEIKNTFIEYFYDIEKKRKKVIT